jgi:putative ABC transport system permease protein
VNDLIDLAFKNILRTKTRTGLTVFGVLIGITAIVALGSISEGINTMINEELEFLGGTIMVTSEEGGGFMMGFGGSEITPEQIDELESFSGVKEVVPLTFAIGEMAAMQGPEYMIIGVDPAKQEFYVGKGIELDSGRELESDNEFSVMLGYKYAEDHDLEVGDTLEFEEEDFEVIGIFEENKDVDEIIVMPLGTMMEVYDLDSYGAAYVVPDNVGKIESLAEEIEEDFDDLSAQTQAEIAKQAAQIVDTIRVFTLGMAGISAVVGGLGVMNTMIMSIMERRREIGIMKSIGATNRFILTQILLESIMITLIGGILGVLIGSLGSYSLRFVAGGLAQARVTFDLVFWSLIFTTFLGLFGGFYPAWKAAKLDPIEAIRYE